MHNYKSNISTKIKNILDPSSPLLSTRLSLLVGLILAISGIILGSQESSLAVQINGFIALIDVVNSVLLMIAVNHSVRTPDYVFNYGYGKYESLTLLISAILLLAVLGYALWEVIIVYIKGDYESGNYSFLSFYSLFSFFLMYGMYKYQKSSAKRFRIPILKFDAEIWKTDSYIELGVLCNLLLGTILIFFGLDYIAKQIDSLTAFMLTALALRIPLKGSKDALNQLLDKTLPDDIQFDIIAVVAENVHEMCEFKSVHTRQSGKDYFVELDIMLPYDYSMEEKLVMEKKIQGQIKSVYPTAISRVYATPCPRDCILHGVRKCPVHLHRNENKKDE
jgi:cation diffusion facilitator family transporter